MKTILISFVLFIVSISTTFSQLNIHGTIRSEKDSIPLDSAMVILRNLVYGSSWDYEVGFKKTFYYTFTNDSGRFEFPKVIIPGLDDETYFTIDVLKNGYSEFTEDIAITDTVQQVDYYLTPYGYYEEDTTPPAPPKPPKAYKEYTSAVFFAGSQFDPKGSYQFNYKAGVSIQTNFKFSPVNYFGLDLHPLLYRRYAVQHDSVNTPVVYSKEYFSTLQYGLGIYLRTHLVSWNKKRNALVLDIGAEYDFPWYYRYINKPDSDTKISLKNFHKYNEFYANARIGILKWFYLRGQYRLTDIFSEPLVELPRWSAEFQIVFAISGH